MSFVRGDEPVPILVKTINSYDICVFGDDEYVREHNRIALSARDLSESE